jgi:chitin disaccharide deacetylase
VRFAIFNADDFGRSPGINRGVIEAHENGVVTSASLMVRWPAAAEAAAYARTCSSLCVGLHVDLGEWTFRDGQWSIVYEVERDPEQELSEQLERFRKLIGRDPTHLDSHQHVHRREPLHSAMLDLAAELGVPARELTGTIRYCGDFYGQTGTGASFPDGISIERLVGLVTKLPPGATEFGCHPGVDNDVDSMYGRERAQEVRVLCDPRVRHELDAAGVQLRSFADLRA